MDLSTKFLNCNGQVMQMIAHSCWFSSLAQASHDQVVNEKELVESFLGCSVRLRDFRDDIVDLRTRCDPTVWHTVKSIFVVDPGCK